MYCPNCAAPIDGAKFCRSCGSNVSLVPQAMSGQLPQSDKAGDKSPWGHHNHWGHFGIHHKKQEPSVESAATSFFTGIGFVIASIAILLYSPAGTFWWWSFLIPAFALIGGGVGSYLRWKELQRKQISIESSGNQAVAYQSLSQGPALPTPTTSELAKPSSVTEHTTRHLE
jgi:hypothetical protein